MLFDEEVQISDRLVVNRSEETNTSFLSKNLVNIHNLNENFYNESMNILLKETYSKTTSNSILVMNESVEDFINKFEMNIKKLTKGIDKTFNEYAKKIAIKFSEDKKLVSKYKDDFLSAQDMKAKCFIYTITNDIPNLKPLNDITDSFKVDITKIDPIKLKDYKKNKSYFNEVRANILGKTNVGISEDKFTENCYKAFRNFSDKMTVIELDPKIKTDMLNTLLSCELELRGLQNDVNMIKDFIHMNIKNVLNEFKFISKNNDLNKFEFDSYTSYIYNKINEIRVLSTFYEVALSYKMDAIKERRKLYMNIFKTVINQSNVSNEKLALNSEEYQFTFDSLNEETFNFATNVLASESFKLLYNEDVNLLSESIIDTLKDTAEKFIEMIKKIFEKFKNKNRNSFDKNFDKMKFMNIIGKDNIKQFTKQAFNYDTAIMKSTVNGFKPVSSVMNNIENDVSNMENFRRKYFPQLYSGYNGKTEEDWKTHVKNKFRGKVLTDPKVIVKRAFVYCNDNTYQSNKKLLEGGMQKLVKSAETIKLEINRMKANTNSTAEQNKTESFLFDLSRDYLYNNIFSEEVEDNAEKVQKNNEKAQEMIDKYKNQKASRDSINTDNADVKDSMNSQNGDSSRIKAMRTYVKELQSVIGYACAIFEEGDNTFRSYLSELLHFSTNGVVGEKEVPKKPEEKQQQKPEEKKKKKLFNFHKK